MPAPEEPTPLRAKLAQLLTALSLGLVLLSIFGVAGLWTLAGAAVLFALACYLDGSLMRWWHRDRRRPRP